MSIISQVKAYAEGVLRELPPEYQYHNLNHTESVVEAVKEIGEAEGLTQQELEIVTIAAWMHDLGYVEGPTEHEERSADMATGLLNELKYNAAQIELVVNCIKATKMPQQPVTKLEKILCDADLYNLGTKGFKQRSLLLRDEVEGTEEECAKSKWYQTTADFLATHTYFTDYAKEKLNPQKLKNLKKMKDATDAKKKSKREIKLEAKVKKLEEKLLTTKEKDTTPTRGIETMFRTTSKNHLDLSAIADQKANIMISINSIILSIVLSVLLRKLEEYPHLVYPTVILVVVCLVTIVLSIMVTRPNVSKGKFTNQDILSKQTNLLFFGNFHGMKLEEYEWGMKELMKDKDYLYGSLIKDIYFLGKVLGKKYRMLRIAYNIFMFGFVVSVGAYFIAEIFFKQYYMY